MKPTRRPLAGLAALLLTTQVQAADGQTIYTQGGANPAAMACGTCHGADGMGMAAAGFPRLAGIDAGYMRKQLADFRSGTRANPIMQPIA
ncbi:c-type cytochrome, partial [Leclercia adecarboxylata]|uniref:c-type cytochrome n=1 Tax=Leclercia adecarboxylata TaxID=83655 RepID=UPI00234E152F